VAIFGNIELILRKSRIEKPAQSLEEAAINRFGGDLES
jgi:hypothetical protein